MAQSQLQTEWASYFVKGQWRYMRPSFMAAGQDSFTLPPGQNPDMFEQLTNVLPPVQGNLQRRWGYSVVNQTLSVNPTLTSVVAAQLYFDLPNNVRRVVWPIGTQVSATNEDGSTYNPAIFAAQATPVRSTSSRSFQYFASGNPADLLKWQGTATGGVTNWGIQTPAGASGPNTAGTGANGGGSGFAWSNPGNVSSSVNYASVGMSPGIQTSQQLQATNFGFALASTDVLKGILVTLQAYHTATNTSCSLQVALLKNGVVVGGVKTIALGTTPTTYTLGSSSDLWGTTLGGADLSASNFGVAIIGYKAQAGFPVINVNNVKVTAYGLIGPTVAVGAAGSVTLVSGRTYFVVFQNSNSGHYSDLSGASASTGPVTGKQINLTGIPVSTDPQVTNAILLATSDGGDQTLLYFVASLTNGTTTYTDNMADTQLVLQNVFLETDAFGNVVGVANNTPPPNNLLFPLAHRGRIYGANGAQLFFSKAESELLTSTGLLAGKFEEAWPGLNYFTVTTGADVITGLLSDGQVLYIGTTKQVIRLFGDGPNNYTVPEALFTDVGVLNQDVWRMVFLAGNPLGCLWITPDYRVIGSDFNTYQDVGRPIQDVLNSINSAAAAQTSWATFMAQGTYALYVLAVPTGANTQPDTLLVFDLAQRMWYIWKLADVAVGGVFDITQAGVPTTFFQAPSGAIYKFDPTQTQDRVGNTPVAIPVTARTTWLSIVDPSARLYLNELEVATGDSGLLVTVEGASTQAQWLTAPNTVVANAPLVTKPRGEFAVFLATAPARDRMYRFTFTSNSTTTNDVLRLLSLEGGVLHRI